MSHRGRRGLNINKKHCWFLLSLEFNCLQRVFLNEKIDDCWNIEHVLQTTWKWSNWRLTREQDGTNVSLISHIHVRFLSCVIAKEKMCNGGHVCQFATVKCIILVKKKAVVVVVVFIIIPQYVVRAPLVFPLCLQRCSWYTGYRTYLQKERNNFEGWMNNKV